MSAILGLSWAAAITKLPRSRPCGRTRGMWPTQCPRVVVGQVPEHDRCPVFVAHCRLAGPAGAAVRPPGPRVAEVSPPRLRAVVPAERLSEGIQCQAVGVHPAVAAAPLCGRPPGSTLGLTMGDVAGASRHLRPKRGLGCLRLGGQTGRGGGKASAQLAHTWKQLCVYTNSPEGPVNRQGSSKGDGRGR